MEKIERKAKRELGFLEIPFPCEGAILTNEPEQVLTPKS